MAPSTTLVLINLLYSTFFYLILLSFILLGFLFSYTPLSTLFFPILLSSLAISFFFFLIFFTLHFPPFLSHSLPRSPSSSSFPSSSPSLPDQFSLSSPLRHFHSIHLFSCSPSNPFHSSFSLFSLPPSLP